MSAAAAPLRVGFVGCGGVVATRHLPALARRRAAVAVALADPDAAALARVGEAFGVARRYRDARELIADDTVEAVAVCTPAAQHVPIALAALAAGRHVLVEKPLALELAEADRLVAAAATAGPKLLVGFNLRWHRLTQQARAIVASGALGRVRAVASLFADPLAGKVDLPEWRRRRALGGGPLLDKGVHHFDLWRHLLADEVVDVAGATVSGACDDEVTLVRARTRGGVLLAAQLLDVSSVANTLTLYGEAASLHLDFYRSDGLELRPAGELPGAPAARLGRLARSLAGLARHAGEVARGGVFVASYERQWEHFARIVRRDLAPGCDARDGREALAIALAALAGAAPGGPP